MADAKVQGVVNLCYKTATFLNQTLFVPNDERTNNFNKILPISQHFNNILKHNAKLIPQNIMPSAKK